MNKKRKKKGTVDAARREVRSSKEHMMSTRCVALRAGLLGNGIIRAEAQVFPNQLNLEICLLKSASFEP